jgi:uncharacterized membrane protein
MAACTKCGATLAEGAGFCASCGAPVAGTGGAAPPPATGSAAASSEGLAPNVAGALAYFTIIPAIVFLVLEPYNRDRFIRFHAFQSLFFGAAMFVLMIGMMIVGVILAFIPIVGWILDIILWFLLVFGSLGLAIYLMYKAYSNEKFVLPVIGKLAEQQASR